MTHALPLAFLRISVSGCEGVEQCTCLQERGGDICAQSEGMPVRDTQRVCTKWLCSPNHVVL